MDATGPLLLVALRSGDADDARILPKIGQLALALAARVELTTVVQPLLYDSVDLDGELIEQTQKAIGARALADLDTQARPLRAAGIAVSTTVQVDVRAHEAIARRAEALNADLVVVGCPPRHRLSGLLQYTDWELVRLCPVPLLLIKDGAPWEHPVVLAAVDPGHAFGKPATLDQEILQQASHLAQCLGGRLHAMHAVSVPMAVALPPMQPFPAAIAELRIAAQARAEQEMDALLCSVGVDAEPHLTSDTPADGIVAVSTATNAAVVVMGAVARSALKRWILGDTALKVLDRLRTDVLIVKPEMAAAQAAALRAPAA